MGNYNGTITCGHCYQTGHNKRTCPSRLERLQRNFEEAKESGSYAEYYGRQIAGMTGTDPTTGAKRSRRTEYGRKCSYCRDYGHNRRKCGTLASDLTRYAALTETVRAEQRALMLEQGIGVGAMVKTNHYGEAAMYLVEKINLGICHPKAQRVAMVLRPINPAHRVTRCAIKPEAEQSSYNGYTVLSPVTAEQITSCVPDGWETQPLDVKDEELENNPFAKGEARDHYFWTRQDERDEEAGE